jgi:hypothetical protein
MNQFQPRIAPHMSDSFGDNLYAPGMGTAPMMSTGDESDQIAMLVNSNASDWLPDR